MATIVQKFGGTSVGSVARIKRVAARAVRTHRAGNRVVVVVSAMAGETNRLLGLAQEIASAPHHREIDVLVSSAGVERFEAARIESTNTHGTGCTLASAIATGLAQGQGIRDAVIRARDYVRDAIRTAPGYGAGHGPLNHAHTLRGEE